MRFSMTPYEREYFVSRIRSGFYLVRLQDFDVKILTPTAEDEFFANQVFMDSFDIARGEDFMTEKEMIVWLKERDLWSDEEEDKIESIQKELEKLKMEIFNARSNVKLREQLRLYIRAAEKALAKLAEKKQDNFTNTCEGIALQDKAAEIFKRCCFVEGKPLDFETVDQHGLFHKYNSQILSDKQTRELARNEPWRSLFILKDELQLFSNKDGRHLSLDQKGILIWSRMYDNVQESMECPTEEVINDDDMLDGWFLIQRKKAEAEKAKSELEERTQNSKIMEADEVFVFTDSRKEVDTIESMNSLSSTMIKKERLATIRGKGGAEDKDFRDQKIKISNMQHQQFKENFRR
jgi:hypothetical protein